MPPCSDHALSYHFSLILDVNSNNTKVGYENKDGANK